MQAAEQVTKIFTVPVAWVVHFLSHWEICNYFYGFIPRAQGVIVAGVEVEIHNNLSYNRTALFLFKCFITEVKVMCYEQSLVRALKNK